METWEGSGRDDMGGEVRGQVEVRLRGEVGCVAVTLVLKPGVRALS